MKLELGNVKDLEAPKKESHATANTWWYLDTFIGCIHPSVPFFVYVHQYRPYLLESYQVATFWWYFNTLLGDIHPPI